MPNFFITHDDGSGPIKDKEPIEFPDEKSASDDAQKSLADVAREKLPNGNHFTTLVKVDDAAGQEVYRASLEFKSQTAAERRAAEAGDASEADRAADELVGPMHAKLID